MLVTGLNHYVHSNRITLDKAIKKANLDPEAVAKWTNEELTTNMSKIFPDLYVVAGKPSFEIQGVVGGKDNIYGQAQKDVSGSLGNYKVVSKGLIYIKKLALNSVRYVASVAGHELNRMVDYVNGNYALWANQYGINGFKYANARSEIGGYRWEMGMGSPYTNYGELMLNFAKMTTNNWKF